MESILTLIKKLLGIEEEYEHFDMNIITDINSAFLTLTQIGVGPSEGFFITDKSSQWVDFLENRKDLEKVKTFIYLSTRLTFDPPSNSFLVDSIKEQLKELTWRLNIQADTFEQEA